MSDASLQRNEELLVASGGRPERFAALYDRVLPDLLAYFARRTLDAQVAADLAAETLAEVFASRMRFRDRGEGSATAWVFAIARRQLGHYRRRRHVEDAARRRLGLERIELAPEDVERAEALMDFEQLRGMVSAAFGGLRRDQREALRLRVIEGRSYAEAAAALGCSKDVVRARVSRGLRRLASELDGW
jgi:RNA polymerase sigma-70 factor (ECF subfamily)